MNVKGFVDRGTHVAATQMSQMHQTFDSPGAEVAAGAKSARKRKLTTKMQAAAAANATMTDVKAAKADVKAAKADLRIRSSKARRKVRGVPGCRSPTGT